MQRATQFHQGPLHFNQMTWESIPKDSYLISITDIIYALDNSSPLTGLSCQCIKKLWIRSLTIQIQELILIVLQLPSPYQAMFRFMTVSITYFITADKKENSFFVASLAQSKHTMEAELTENLPHTPQIADWLGHRVRGVRQSKEQSIFLPYYFAPNADHSGNDCPHPPCYPQAIRSMDWGEKCNNKKVSNMKIHEQVNGVFS